MASTNSGIMATNLLGLDQKDIEFPKMSSVTTAVARKLVVTNVSNHEHIAFKVKTTAPKAYLVRPSSGVLSGKGTSQEIQIILQPQSESTENHRFMVQGAIVDSPAEADIKTMWKDLSKDKIHEQRMNVIWKDDATPAAPASVATSVPAAAGAPAEKTVSGGDRSLQTKYDELVKQTLMKEKEINALKEKVKKSKDSAITTSGGGYSLKDVILVALISFVVAFLLRYF